MSKNIKTMCNVFIYKKYIAVFVSKRKRNKLKNNYDEIDYGHSWLEG